MVSSATQMHKQVSDCAVASNQVACQSLPRTPGHKLAPILKPQAFTPPPHSPDCKPLPWPFPSIHPTGARGGGDKGCAVPVVWLRVCMHDVWPVVTNG